MKSVRKIIFLGLLLTLTLQTSACSKQEKETAHPFEGMYLPGCSMKLVKYDGESAWDYQLSGADQSEAKETLYASLCEAEAVPAEIPVSGLHGPYYALHLADLKGQKIYCFADGYLITDTGETYQFNYDPGELLSQFDYTLSQEWPDRADRKRVFTAWFYPVMKVNGKWNKELLSEVEEKEPPVGLLIQPPVKDDTYPDDILHVTM